MRVCVAVALFLTSIASNGCAGTMAGDVLGFKNIPASGAYTVNLPTTDQNKPLAIPEFSGAIARVFIGNVNMTLLTDSESLELDRDYLSLHVKDRISSSLTKTGFIETKRETSADYRVDATVQKIMLSSGSGKNAGSMDLDSITGNSDEVFEGTWIECEVRLQFLDPRSGDVWSFDGRGVESRENGTVANRVKLLTNYGGTSRSEWKTKPADVNIIPDTIRYATLSAAIEAAAMIRPTIDQIHAMPESK